MGFYFVQRIVTDSDGGVPLEIIIIFSLKREKMKMKKKKKKNV